MSSQNNTITLNTGNEMPLLGLGVYKAADNQEVIDAIHYAVDSGYRLIDTASVYKNEAGVGTAIKTCSINRADLFVTTKVWNNAQRVGDIQGAFERSLGRLQLDYVDLYLVHWPVPGCYMDTWRELEKIYKSGKAKAIGVSNFNPHHLEDLKKVSDIVPAVNQIEFHPLINQSEVVQYCHANNIAVQAYCPLARGAYLDNPVICEIAAKHGKTAAQVGLRWSLQKGVAVIPKSVKQSRIVSNSEIFDFELTSEEMSLIDGENKNYRIAADPENFDL